MNVKDLKQQLISIKADISKIEKLIEEDPVLKQKDIIRLLSNLVIVIATATEGARDPLRGGHIAICDKCGGVDTARSDGICSQCGNTSYEIEIRD